MGQEDLQIQNNESAHRFETSVDGQMAFVNYHYWNDSEIVLTHTEVPAVIGGRGIGTRLARAALDYARARGLRVTSTCPFITSYIEKHPEYHSLLAANLAQPPEES